jgi:polyisoprenoid-binding protein YceI
MLTMKTFALAAALTAAFAAAHAEPVTYNFDPTHTTVLFEASHFGTSTLRGRFDKKEGTVQLDRAAKTGRVEVGIDMTSVSTGVEPFNKHLQSKDFFNAAEFPSAKFVGDKFIFNGDKLAEVSGQLTLAGKTNPVTLKATNFNCYQNPIFKREVCGGDFETTLTRSQFGINYGLPQVSPDAVRLIVQVEAVRAQ